MFLCFGIIKLQKSIYRNIVVVLQKRLKMKKIFAKIICCFVPFRGLRRLIRLKADVPVRKYVKYAKSFSSSKHPRIEVSCGYRGANLVVNVDDKYIFKFPRYGDARAISLREKQITDALRPISPIKIPEMQILHFNGVYVRKYEYVKGIGFHFFHFLKGKCFCFFYHFFFLFIIG